MALPINSSPLPDLMIQAIAEREARPLDAALSAALPELDGPKRAEMLALLDALAQRLLPDEEAQGDTEHRPAAADASMRFAPEEGPDVFRPLGWEPVEIRSSWEEARRLGREPWLLRLIWAFSSPRQRESYRNVSRYVLLGRH